MTGAYDDSVEVVFELLKCASPGRLLVLLLLSVLLAEAVVDSGGRVCGSIQLCADDEEASRMRRVLSGLHGDRADREIAGCTGNGETRASYSRQLP